MSLSYHFLLHVIIISFSLYSIPLPSDAITAELLHRDSLTPMTTAEKIRAAVNRSITRVNHWHFLSRISEVSLSLKVHPATFEFLMEIALGTPPVSISGAPDTGSDLIWTECSNFNPRKSSSYKRVNCGSKSCIDLGEFSHCGPRRSCRYSISYGDKSSTFGDLSRDSITFNSSSGEQISFNNVIFGCGRNMTGSFDRGIIGLGKGPLSLVSQLKESIQGQFSYCLVPISESGSSSFFNLGKAAHVSGAGATTIPIVSPANPLSPSFYYLPLREISVGGDLGIPAHLEMIIDCGTAVTMLPESVVRSITSALKSKIGAPTVRDPQRQFDLCYDFESSPGIVDAVPDIVLEFAGGNVTLKPENTFLPSDNGVKCLAITPSPSRTFALLGFFAQHNFHVGYDLVMNTVTMTPTKCAEMKLGGCYNAEGRTGSTVEGEEPKGGHRGSSANLSFTSSLFLLLSLSLYIF